MFSALRVFLCAFFIVFSAYAEDHEDRFNQNSKSISDKSSKINNLITKLRSKSLKANERKQLQKEKDDLVLENFKLRIERKNEQRRAMREYARRYEKIELKYSPRGICQNPCSINMEAVVNKKIKSLIGKYVFYVDEKAIESLSPNLSTTIYFSKSMLTDRQKLLLSKKIPLHKFFKLRVEGIISETRMLESKPKRLVVKSQPSNLTNIELVTNKVIPYGKIQIAINGISATKLQGTINNTPINFEVDPSVGSSQILYTFAPNLAAGNYQISISNFNLNLEIEQIPTVSNPNEYVRNFSNNSVNLGSIINESGRYNALLGYDGVALFSKFNDVVVAFDNYLKNEATPEDIQEIANVINANAIGDNNVYFFVKNDKESVRKFFSNSYKSKLVFKVISMFVESSYAQEKPRGALFNYFYSIITKFLEDSFTTPFNTLIDGMVNKCYISKGRIVPSYVKNSEASIQILFSTSIGAVLKNRFAGALGFYSTISAAQALVILIGQDCEGDSTIIPKMVIQSQPSAPIKPGSAIEYKVKCDVGDPRYYKPGSILTRVSSKFEYISDELSDAGDLISRDKLVDSCVGLGKKSINESNDISCTTNILEETSYYQNNSAQYETINPALCSGENNSYDVGTYQVSSPDFSCNFVNQENNVNIIGEKVVANQIVFDLSKQIICPPKPKAVINYAKNNLVVTFDSTDPLNPNAEDLEYQWDFGDGQIVSTYSKSISHSYNVGGNYNVKLTVVNKSGMYDTVSVQVTIGNYAPVTLCAAGNTMVSMTIEVINDVNSPPQREVLNNCECHTFQFPIKLVTPAQINATTTIEGRTKNWSFPIYRSNTDLIEYSLNYILDLNPLNDKIAVTLKTQSPYCSQYVYK